MLVSAQLTIGLLGTVVVGHCAQRRLNILDLPGHIMGEFGWILCGQKQLFGASLHFFELQIIRAVFPCRIRLVMLL